MDEVNFKGRVEDLLDKGEAARGCYSGLRKDIPESNERRYYPKVMRRDHQGKCSKAAKW